MIIGNRYRKFEEKYFKKRKYNYTKYNYLGDWHSHPTFDPSPSGYDLIQLREDFELSNAHFLISFVFRVEERKLVGSAVYIDDSKVFKDAELIIEI